MNFDWSDEKYSAKPIEKYYRDFSWVERFAFTQMFSQIISKNFIRFQTVAFFDS